MESNLVISIPNIKKKKKKIKQNQPTNPPKIQEFWEEKFLKCGFPTFLSFLDTWVPLDFPW